MPVPACLVVSGGRFSRCHGSVVVQCLSWTLCDRFLKKKINGQSLVSCRHDVKEFGKKDEEKDPRTTYKLNKVKRQSMSYSCAQPRRSSHLCISPWNSGSLWPRQHSDYCPKRAQGGNR
ncbi:hypothetical protein E2C01_043681 [Portunus trituberculatus]|uniref:Uncharacterized protein n=1 Tax=Portunus trituberculatus TaxID=210409 RepID=A0A5B7FWC3_PORTR|nr:hypothetical protein [Portunus trituberculatus]